jgi:cell division protein FtsI (penicillin-binding protein 3)
MTTNPGSSKFPANEHRHGRHQARSGRDGAVAHPAPLLSEWRSTLRSRLIVCAVVIAAWTVGIEARLLYLQVVQYDELMEIANRQQLDPLTLPAKRGEILDRNGEVLAYSVDADTIFADPTEVGDVDSTAAKLCAALDDCDAAGRRAMAKALRRDSHFAYLARQVSPDEAYRVRQLDLQGIAFLKESRRYYPKKELASHVLVYVGIDNVGLAGLESTYDSLVRGQDGRILIQTDARQHAIHSRVDRPATAGATLELTIDQYLQHIAERELRAGVEENRAKGGTALIMDPQSGEILALANWPTFNPNTFARADEHARRNRGVQDLYEPGSTFKVVTASAAFEEHVITAADPIDCAPGHIRFGSRIIHDVHAYGVLPFSDVIVKSSNVGAIKVGLRLGPERLGRYISRFGFGQTISPDFRGENPGIVWNPAKLDPSALASVSMGYQVGVTPLQMAAAVSAVANGGTLYEPRVIRASIKEGRRVPVQRKALRRTVSERTAAELTAIMEAVVERGTAKSAQVEGYTIAGKTGTAAKIVDGRYSNSEYNASFVGFLPSRKPALTIVVVIDSPHAVGYYGGVVAAPVFRRIAEASLRHLGIPPNIGAFPPVLRAVHEGEGAPVEPRLVGIKFPVLSPFQELERGVMPELRGLSAREALRLLTQVGATARMVGNGFVNEQTPAAGTVLTEGQTTLLTLGRRPPPLATGGSEP